MNRPAADEGAAAAPVIDSRTAWRSALQWGFDAAIARGARSITCVDADFAEWPLDAPELLERLTAWLRLPQRRLQLLAAGYDAMQRLHPRFVIWRTPWVHAIPGWQAPADLAADLPSLLLADNAVAVQLIDARHWRGRAAIDVRAARLWQERLDAVFERAEPAFAAKTLGL